MFAKLARSQSNDRMATIDEVAPPALYLCSDPSSSVTRADYPLNGGFFTRSWSRRL